MRLSLLVEKLPSHFFESQLHPASNADESRRRRLCRGDATGQALAYVYARETQAEADTAKVLTMDKARRAASNIAKLPC